LGTKQIIQGVELDPRIGRYYNNSLLLDMVAIAFPKSLGLIFKKYPIALISAIFDGNST
jgi:UDP-glucose 6-dehydrogenase